MNANGFDQTRLTNNADKDDDPSWSPDGAKIAFSSQRDGNTAIYVRNVGGSNQTRLTDAPCHDAGPAGGGGTRLDSSQRHP